MQHLPAPSPCSSSSCRQAPFSPPDSAGLPIPPESLCCLSHILLVRFSVCLHCSGNFPGEGRDWVALMLVSQSPGTHRKYPALSAEWVHSFVGVCSAWISSLPSVPYLGVIYMTFLPQKTNDLMPDTHGHKINMGRMNKYQTVKPKPRAVRTQGY